MKGHNVALGRRAADALSATTIRKVMVGQPVQRAEEILKSFIAEGVVPSGLSRVDAFSLLVKFLESQYRNELVYKSAITEKIYIGRHGVKSASSINEFSVAGSFADTVLTNGKSTVYEIKTELDSATKLHKQLADYLKAFRNVYVVTHESLEQEYQDKLSDTPVGLMVLTKRGSLSERRRPSRSDNLLDITTMMKALRKKEYTDVINGYFGIVFDFSPVDWFRNYLKLALRIPVVEFQTLFEAQLRGRSLKYPELLQQVTASPVRHYYVQLDPNPLQHNRIQSWLNSEV